MRTCAAALAIVAFTLPMGAQTETLAGHLNLIWVDSPDRGEAGPRVYLTVDRDNVVRLVPAAGVQFDFEELRRMNGRMVIASGARSTLVMPNGQPSTDFDVRSLRLKDRSGNDAVRAVDDSPPRDVPSRAAPSI